MISNMFILIENKLNGSLKHIFTKLEGSCTIYFLKVSAAEIREDYPNENKERTVHAELARRDKEPYITCIWQRLKGMQWGGTTV